MEHALIAQGELLAHALGPALASAAASARELDELLAWKLLDNARLLALASPRALADERELAVILEANGLDAILWFSPAGEMSRAVGVEASGPALQAGIDELLESGADELVLGSVGGTHSELVAAAVALPGGGALATLSDPGRAFALGRRIGVTNLLESTIETEAVLYLVYEEVPDGLWVEASWDAGPVPPSLESPLGEVRGRTVFEVTVPVASLADVRASLRVGLDGAPLERAVGSALRRTALVGTVLTALGAAGITVAFLLAARQRERQITERTLADAEEARRRSDRLAAAGALAAGLAHEVRNPLNAIGLAAQQTARIHGSESRTGALAARIRREVDRLEESLEGFLDLARPAATERRPTELADLVREAVDLLRVEAEARDIELVTTSGAARVPIDREAVRGAIVNLIRNAVQASPAGSRVEVAIEVESTTNAAASGATGFARVVVRDSGSGLAKGLGSRVFEPFVSGRAEGTGLGLAIVRRVAEEHGGGVRLDGRRGGGIEATLELPIEA